MNIRKSIRNNEYSGVTAGYLESYLQVNLTILPKHLAEELVAFGKLNPKVCPIIECSDDQLRFSDLGDVDVKRDVPKYRIYENGQYREVLDLVNEQLEGYLAVATGCSFTFEHALLEAGIPMKHIEMSQNVAMYKTNRQCQQTEHFSGKMVVSMRPIKKNRLHEVIDITSSYNHVHGIPIHIGDPKVLGIDDLKQPDYGDFLDVKEDELPVFWPCGVTVQNILTDCIDEVFYTHAPGHMLITHKKIKTIEAFDLEESLKGMLMKGSYERNMSGVTYLNHVEKFCKALLIYDHITLITGFGVKNQCVGETDGPLGTLWISKALKALGKEVLIVTDKYSYKLMTEGLGYINEDIPITMSLEAIETDCLFAIERPGKSDAGKYHSMKGEDIGDVVGDTDDFIEKMQHVPLYAIGDGGNEVGMGKIREYIESFVPHGDEICSRIAAKELLVAGTSNWGCYVVLTMLSYLTDKNLLHSIEDEKALLQVIVDAGAVDGVTHQAEMTVDGYDLESYLSYISALNDLLEKAKNID